jgi:hypothetical protein
MKKAILATYNSKQFFSILFAVIVFVACKKDLGNYDYVDANQIIITSTTVDSFVVKGFDTLNININVSQTKDNAALTYQWYIIQYTSSNANPPQYILSTTKNLSAVITEQPGLYKVVVKITDNTTGVSFYKYFPLSVVPDAWGGEGWLVLQDQSALQGGSDFSVILSRDGATHGDVYHNLYYKANGRKLPSNSSSIWISTYGYTLGIQKVSIAYPGGATQVKYTDFTDSSLYYNWFLIPPPTYNLQYNACRDGGQYEILVNNNQLYYSAVNVATLKAPPILFGAPLQGSWTLDPHILQFSGSGLEYYVTFYDSKNMCFATVNLQTNALISNLPDVPNAHYAKYTGTAASLLPTGSGFDMNNVGNRVLVAASNITPINGSVSSPGTYWDCFFRNTTGDSSFVYQFPVYLAYSNGFVSNARFYLDPSKCAGINNATMFDAPTGINIPGVFYYVNGNSIYTGTLSATQGNSTASIGYSFSTGAIIKSMKIFQCGYSGTTLAPNTPIPATDGKVLVVATDETASGKGNNVYFFNISNTGQIVTPYVDSYSGFNKIVDIKFKKAVGK